MTNAVVGVLAASGGLGASTLSAALALRMAQRSGRATLIDGDVLAGGLDVTTGIEHVPGLRWADLIELRGPVDVEELHRALPGGHGVGVLSAGRGETAARLAPDEGTRHEVAAALAVERSVVVDLPRSAPDRDALLGLCTTVVLLCGTHVRALADADALVEALVDHKDHVPRGLHLVTRGPRARSDLAEVVEQHLGVPHLAHLADDGRVARLGERGEWPGRRHTALVPVVDAILDVTLPPVGMVS